MPWSATITARGRSTPCASQRRSGSLVPSRAVIASSVTMGVTPPSTGGAKAGAQADKTSRANTKAMRTSHPEILRHGGIGLVAQHQHAGHHNMIHPCFVLAERQDRTFIIDELCI